MKHTLIFQFSRWSSLRIVWACVIEDGGWGTEGICSWLHWKPLSWNGLLLISILFYNKSNDRLIVAKLEALNVSTYDR